MTRPSPPYQLRRFSRPADATHHTSCQEMRDLPAGTTRAEARKECAHASRAHPDDLVTLVREGRIMFTFRNGVAMRAAAIAQPASTFQPSIH